MASPALLVVNDDGINSEGLRALADVLADLGEVYVVAPDRERSAVSHALTLHRPLRVEQVGERCYTVDGTPSDAVNLAVNGMLPRRPELLAAGINKGGNLGDYITYSGTVSAAMEGTLLGVPSIAVSLVSRGPFDFGAAARVARRLAAAVLRHGLPRDTLLNVNVPERLTAGEEPRLALTRQGRLRSAEPVVEKTDPRGKKYYWIGGDGLGFGSGEGTDFAAVSAGIVSVTPIQLDLTNYASFAELGFLIGADER